MRFISGFCHRGHTANGCCAQGRGSGWATTPATRNRASSTPSPSLTRPPPNAPPSPTFGEEIDATRKIVQAEHPDITLTGLYNLVEKLRAAGSGPGPAGSALTPAEADTARRARAAIILELHRRLDAAVAAAYGWDADLAPAEIVARLVALNAERAAEEAAGTIRWLRPDYQAGRAV